MALGCQKPGISQYNADLDAAVYPELYRRTDEITERDPDRDRASGTVASVGELWGDLLGTGVVSGIGILRRCLRSVWIVWKRCEDGHGALCPLG